MPMVSFDENEFSLRGKANDFTIAALAEEFQAVRQSTVAFFQNLPESLWQNVGQVMGDEVTGGFSSNASVWTDTPAPAEVSVQARLAGFSAAVPGSAGWPWAVKKLGLT